MKRILRAILVDDEEHARITLRYALSKHANWQLVAELSNAASASEFLANNQVDVVFLDIQMPRMSGLELARSLATGDNPPLIVFVTAYHTHAIDAFELHALDYLLKPFSPDRFARTLERAAAMLEHQAQAAYPAYAEALSAYLNAEELRNSNAAPVYLQQVVVRSVGMMERIALEQVLWMAAASNYVELHLDGRVVLHRVPLSKLEEYLDPSIFIRVHRSVIVRADQCVYLQTLGNGSYQLRLRCGDQISVSKNYVDAVRQLLHCVQ